MWPWLVYLIQSSHAPFPFPLYYPSLHRSLVMTLLCDLWPFPVTLTCVQPWAGRWRGGGTRWRCLSDTNLSLSLLACRRFALPTQSSGLQTKQKHCIQGECNIPGTDTLSLSVSPSCRFNIKMLSCIQFVFILKRSKYLFSNCQTIHFVFKLKYSKYSFQVEIKEMHYFQFHRCIKHEIIRNFNFFFFFEYKWR